MLDFLNDKKNQPIVVGVLVLIIIGVGVFCYFMFIKQPGSSTPATNTAAYTEPAPTPPPNPAETTPGIPGQTGPSTPGFDVAAQIGSSPQVVVASAVSKPAPVEKYRVDPFKMLHQPKPVRHAGIARPEFIPYPTWRILPRKPRVDPGWVSAAEEADTTERRMAGILYSGAVSAILETGTEFLVVKPGDVVENGAMRVDKIEPDCIVLRSLIGKPRTVQVKLAGSQNTAAALPSATPPSVSPRPGTPPFRRGVGGPPSSVSAGT